MVGTRYIFIHCAALVCALQSLMDRVESSAPGVIVSTTILLHNCNELGQDIHITLWTEEVTRLYKKGRQKNKTKHLNTIPQARRYTFFTKMGWALYQIKYTHDGNWPWDQKIDPVYCKICVPYWEAHFVFELIFPLSHIAHFG